MSRLRLRVPSPAFVVAVVALILALGGTSYAAFQIGTRNIRNGAVTNPKLAANSVGTGKIRNGAVTGSKLNLTGVTVPSANTANALNGVTIVSGPSQLVGPNTLQSQTVTCPAGLFAIGAEQVNNGGNTASTNEVVLNGASALVFINNLSTTTSVTWHAYVVCIRGSVSGTSVAHSAK